MFCSTCFGGTICPSSRAQSSNCYVVVEITFYNHVAVRLACTNIPNDWYSLVDTALDDEQRVRPKHEEQNKKNKDYL